ncbi:DUF2231 domain-containing protein [Rheinheimera hassiensis]|uniref:DUF2231 domain-containing protein n=1 Tax=Rheinheimera hassiensis TaxID=1193627 RepID=UPI001F06C374|nr:DUF2231 domain-containing protein [Rheinheimera hassiensis]
MIVSDTRLHQPRLHPIHGVLLAGTFVLFFIGLLSDLAYMSSYQIQWSNFASWLIAAGLLFGGLSLLWAIINLIRAVEHGRQFVLYTALLLALWVLGFINALIHARDAWAVMPTGLILSVIGVLLAGVTTWLGFAKFGVGGVR